MCQHPCKTTKLRAERTKTRPTPVPTPPRQRTTVSFDAGRPQGGGELICNYSGNYSYLNASAGSRLGARRAGYKELSGERLHSLFHNVGCQDLSWVPTLRLHTMERTKALAGELSAFTGISDPYEPPLSPELILHTDKESPAESAARVIDRLRELGFLDLRRGDQ
jgi:hypothetical protein